MTTFLNCADFAGTVGLSEMEKYLVIGIGAGCGVLLIMIIAILCCCICRYCCCGKKCVNDFMVAKFLCINNKFVLI